MASSSASASLPGSVITVASSTTAVGASSGVTGSPCAACKFLRRKCQPDCVFAPYFPPDNPRRFVHVHRVFGASNVTKLLNELSPFQREDAVNSLAYEADVRLRDPVYGCIGVISLLQHQLRQHQQELNRTRYELSKYQAAAAAAAVSASVGCNGQPPAMAEFIDNMMPHCTQNIININHSTAAAAAAIGFGEHDQYTAVQMMARSYDGEAGGAIARLNMNVGGSSNGGGYDFGYSSGAMGVGPVAGLPPLGGRSFFKAGTAGRDDRPTAAQ